jgi:hypothetical protein
MSGRFGVSHLCAPARIMAEYGKVLRGGFIVSLEECAKSIVPFRVISMLNFPCSVLRQYLLNKQRFARES